MNRYELENRLVNFSVLILEIEKNLPQTKAANHLGSQLVRSGTSCALNYGEAQSGESSNDFIHKLKIVLKELRETNVNLKILSRGEVIQNSEILSNAIQEVNELISIFVRSIVTAEKNKKQN